MKIKMFNRHASVERISFHSIGKGWLVTVCIPMNKLMEKYRQDDVDKTHDKLYNMVKTLCWALDNGDGFQVITGELLTPRQYFKQHIYKNNGNLEFTERFTIHKAV
jgi:hypothetical protein